MPEAQNLNDLLNGATLGTEDRGDICIRSATNELLYRFVPTTKNQEQHLDEVLSVALSNARSFAQLVNPATPHNIDTSLNFGLRHKITGKLALMHAQDNDSADFCGESRYTLSEDESWCERLFEVDDPRKAALALAINTPWYNSTAETPGWGSVDITQYEVVEILRTTAIRAIEVALPLKFDHPVEQYNKTRSIVERYLGHPLPVPLIGDVVQMLVMYLPDGETVASLQVKCQDCDVLVGPDTQYLDRALGAFELPEEYADLLKGKPGFGLILTREKR